MFESLDSHPLGSIMMVQLFYFGFDFFMKLGLEADLSTDYVYFILF